MKYLFVFLIVLKTIDTFSQDVAILKYNGGGDWYANPTAIPNLVAFTNKNINTRITTTPESVAANSEVVKIDKEYRGLRNFKDKGRQLGQKFRVRRRK